MPSKDRLRALERRAGIGETFTCIWFDDPEQPVKMIACPHANKGILLSECPKTWGGPCEFSSNFIRLIIEEVENGSDDISIQKEE